MLKKILLGLVALVAVVLVAAAMQPSDFTVTRSATMNAPASAVFAQVNNFHRWNDWSPWAKRDPQAKNTFGGPEEGVGATFAWAGNSDVGEGKMTIMESQPPSLIRVKLEFLKPFPSVADTEFTFQPTGNQTTMNWTMKGTNNFIGKVFCLFMNMDKMVGGDFEKGLSSIKEVVEKKG